MAWTDYDAPTEFFGHGYDMASSTINLKTVTATGATVGTTFQGEADDNVITTATAHGLTVGDRVRVTQGTTLPSGLSEGTDYYVLTVPSTTTFTIGAARGGSTVVLGTDGSADNTVQLMGLLDEVTDTEANETSGDARKVIYGLLEAIYTRYQMVPTDDRPAKMSIFRSTSENSDGTFSRNYTFQFTLDGTGFEVSPE